MTESVPRWLTTLLQLRRQHRDDCRRRFQEAQQAGDVLAEKKSALDAQVERTNLTRRNASGSGACDVNLLLAAQRYQIALQTEHRLLEEQIELVDREAERRRSTLIEAEQQLRVLEKLAEQKAQLAGRQSERREAKRLDDLAAIMPKAHQT